MATHYIISPCSKWIESIAQYLNTPVSVQTIVLPDVSDWFTQKKQAGSESTPKIQTSALGEFHALSLDALEEDVDGFTLYCPTLLDALENILHENPDQVDGQQLLTAVATWQKQAQQILSLTLTYREQCYLIVETANNSRIALLKRPELQGFFKSQPDTADTQSQDDPETALLNLMLNTDRPLQKFYRQLLSAANNTRRESAGLPDKKSLPEALILCLEFWKLKQENPLERSSANEELQTELELAHLQIAQLREELEEYFLKWQQTQSGKHSSEMKATPDTTLRLAAKILEHNPQLAQR